MPKSHVPDVLEMFLRPRTLPVSFSHMATRVCSVAFGAVPWRNWAIENCSAPESALAARLYAGIAGLSAGCHPERRRILSLGVISALSVLFMYPLDERDARRSIDSTKRMMGRNGGLASNQSIRYYAGTRISETAWEICLHAAKPSHDRNAAVHPSSSFRDGVPWPRLRTGRPTCEDTSASNSTSPRSAHSRICRGEGVARRHGSSGQRGRKFHPRSDPSGRAGALQPERDSAGNRDRVHHEFIAKPDLPGYRAPEGQDRKSTR